MAWHPNPHCIGMAHREVSAARGRRRARVTRPTRYGDSTAHPARISGDAHAAIDQMLKTQTPVAHPVPGGGYCPRLVLMIQQESGISDYFQPLFQILFKGPGSMLPVFGPARNRSLRQLARSLVFINPMLQFRLLRCRQFSKGIQNVLVYFHEEGQGSLVSGLSTIRPSNG